MLSRNVLVALPILILTSLPAYADGYYRHRNFDNRGPSTRDLQLACNYGSRGACIDLGRAMQQNRDRRWAQRQAYFNKTRERAARDMAHESRTVVVRPSIFPHW